MPHILLFDDEAETRYFMVSELAKDYEVLEGACAADLEQLARRGEPLAVVSDLHMGEGPNGAEVLDQARRLWPRAARIIVSGSGSAQALVAIGVAHLYVAKPWHRGELLKAVQGLLQDARGVLRELSSLS